MFHHQWRSVVEDGVGGVVYLDSMALRVRIITYVVSARVTVFPTANKSLCARPMGLSGLPESFAAAGVKTQGFLPSAQAAELFLFGLIISGQIRLPPIDGWRDLKQVTLSP
jgi:hypothetical protein